VFATLLGGLPRPPLPEDVRPEDLVVAAVAAQAARGIEPLTDGRVLWADRYADAVAGLEGIERDTATGTLRMVAAPSRVRPLAVAAYRRTRTLTDRAVKQALPGPYTLGRWVARDPGLSREAVTIALAIALREEVLELAAAGCPLIEIEERDAAAIGSDPRERALFREAHDALTSGVRGVHLSLALTGPSAESAGGPTVLHPAYASYGFDLIEGPGGWDLVVDVPGDRGVVCGALATRPDLPHGPDLLLYAAGYAASTGGRGLARVGLAPAGGLESLDWPRVERLLDELAEGVLVASMPSGRERAERLDPRATDLRSAALGRYSPPRRAKKA
jgi:hypothetical protein